MVQRQSSGETHPEMRHHSEQAEAPFFKRRNRKENEAEEGRSLSIQARVQVSIGRS